MVSQEDIQKIKETTEEFLQKMTIPFTLVRVAQSAPAESKPKRRFTIVELAKELGGFGSNSNADAPKEEVADSVAINIQLPEAQFLIGQGGQTLVEFQHILKMVLRKKILQRFYVDVDISDYKKKKVLYIQQLTNDVADEVAGKKEKKALPPMSSYERRVVHAELAKRSDIISESEGLGENRRVVIKPK